MYVEPFSKRFTLSQPQPSPLVVILLSSGRMSTFKCFPFVRWEHFLYLDACVMMVEDILEEEFKPSTPDVHTFIQPLLADDI